MRLQRLDVVDQRYQPTYEELKRIFPAAPPRRGPVTSLPMRN